LTAEDVVATSFLEQRHQLSFWDALIVQAALLSQPITPSSPDVWACAAASTAVRNRVGYAAISISIHLRIDLVKPETHIVLSDEKEGSYVFIQRRRWWRFLR
jgi:hypothetical protein